MTDDYPFKNRDCLYEGTHAGIRWAIYQAPLNSVLNGYARIPDGVRLNADDLEVHGGITYGSGDCTGWVGFDTAHTGDLWDLDDLREKVGIHVSEAGIAWHERELAVRTGMSCERTWTVAALKAECERLCEEIAAKSNVALSKEWRL